MAIGLWKFCIISNTSMDISLCVCMCERERERELSALYLVLCPVRHWLGVSKDDTLMNPGCRIF